MLSINEERTVERITEWMQKVFKKAGFSRAVLGLSGGVDSAVVAFLAVKALGKENLICVKMPYKTSVKSSVDDADRILDMLDVRAKTVDISPAVDAFSASLNNVSPARRGNIMARARMTVLFDTSAELEALVLGTSNKTERLLGYGTLHGDLASIVNPLGDLYKTQVWAIAKYLGVPEEVINKAPSADLIEGQTDEKDFGFTYRQADDVLDAIVDEKRSMLDTVNLGYTMDHIQEVLDRMERNKYKGEVPYIFDLRVF
jgi:NAD+ synthase